MSFHLNDDVVGRMIKDCSYKGSEHREIFKKDLVTFFALATSGINSIKDKRAVSATEEYSVEVIFQDRQFPFVLADQQMQNHLREVCRPGEVPNMFKEGGSVRVARRSQLGHKICTTTTAPGPSEGPGAAARSSGRGQEQRQGPGAATRGGFKNRWLSLRQLLANGGALVCSLAGLRKLIKQGVRPSSIVSTSVVATVYWCVIFASDFCSADLSAV
jgi:hypothetical protein